MGDLSALKRDLSALWLPGMFRLTASQPFGAVEHEAGQNHRAANGPPSAEQVGARFQPTSNSPVGVEASTPGRGAYGCGERMIGLAPDRGKTFEAVRRGALLVDIRPQAQRAAEGVVPGALHVERNVLEWRLDPGGEARLPQASGYDRHVIVMCSQGYASSLAAESLRRLG